MVKAENIRIETHLADFRCDKCGTFQQDVNVNTELSYDEKSTTIIVPCSNGSCDCTSFYPTSGGTAMAIDLAAAKTE